MRGQINRKKVIANLRTVHPDWPLAKIGAAVNCSREYARQVLVEFGLPTRAVTHPKLAPAKADITTFVPLLSKLTPLLMLVYMTKEMMGAFEYSQEQLVFSRLRRVLFEAREKLEAALQYINTLERSFETKSPPPSIPASLLPKDLPFLFPRGRRIKHASSSNVDN